MKKIITIISGVSLILMAACTNTNTGPSGMELRQQMRKEIRQEHSAPVPEQGRLQQEENSGGGAGVNRTSQQSAGADSSLMRLQASTPELEDGLEEQIREPAPMSLADLHRKYPSTFVLSGSEGRREVALTFDDAPDAVFTPLVLDALKKAGVKATFFCVGNRIEAHPDVMRRIVAEGHVVGNHSYSHPNFIKLSDARFREEIQKTDRLVKAYTGYAPSFVRPPYGNISEEQIKWLASNKRRVVNWNVDSLDWKNLNREQVAVNVLAHIGPGAIVLQHSGGGVGQDLTGTVQAVPEIVAKLKRDGVRFVTIPGMLGIPQ
ncbi:polysaccharide deacetylase family protein [Paenibacillus tarimensis]|uniref:polysaccharide deacetylase family protein n=1 Tax=Paenibacillus tarimensis TaxID=416012 RepID=UPI001F29AF31|nr:polysaccharide deacetylase family protein [Paenibacillus tarimensis]MCF2945981.1 polysaccharide deacetylase family protein [Paenibacillus tarimensis]